MLNNGYFKKRLINKIITGCKKQIITRTTIQPDTFVQPDTFQLKNLLCFRVGVNDRLFHLCKGVT